MEGHLQQNGAGDPGKVIGMDSRNLILYAVTDRQWLHGARLADQVAAAIRGGIRCLQLREKDLAPEDFLAEAATIKQICNRAGIPFLINDDVEIGLACGADGVHIGQSDGEADAVRQRIGKDKILGVSVRTVAEAIAAERGGADYLGVGAMFPTGTKIDAKPVSFQVLKDICGAVAIPAVAIGGITMENMDGLKGSGVAGVALVSAIFAATNIEETCRQLLTQAKELFS